MSGFSRTASAYFSEALRNRPSAASPLACFACSSKSSPSSTDAQATVPATGTVLWAELPGHLLDLGVLAGHEQGCELELHPSFRGLRRRLGGVRLGLARLVLPDGQIEQAAGFSEDIQILTGDRRQSELGQPGEGSPHMAEGALDERRGKQPSFFASSTKKRSAS